MVILNWLFWSGSKGSHEGQLTPLMWSTIHVFPRIQAVLEYEPSSNTSHPQIHVEAAAALCLSEIETALK